MPWSVKDIAINHLPPADEHTLKGRQTWNWPWPDPSTIISGRTMVVYRRRGDQVGNHAHPEVPDKNPELFLLIDGRIRFWFEDLRGQTREEYLEAKLGQSPIEIRIFPHILHGLDVLSEAAIFLEHQRSPYDPNNSLTPQQFHALKS